MTEIIPQTKKPSSSAEWFAHARNLWKNSQNPPYFFRSMDYVDPWQSQVDQAHLGDLLNPLNWASSVVSEQRRPRVFLDGRINQSGNLEVRWAGGDHNLFFEEDFEKVFAWGAGSGGYGAHRSRGELLWAEGVSRMRELIDDQQCQISKAMLAGYSARISELVAELSARVDLVGYVTLEVGDDGSLDFTSSLSRERHLELSCAL